MKKILKRLLALCAAIGGTMVAQYMNGMRESDKQTAPKPINSAKREIWVVCEPGGNLIEESLMEGWIRDGRVFAGTDVSIVEGVHDRSERILKNLVAVITAETPADRPILITHSHAPTATLLAESLKQNLNCEMCFDSDWLDPEYHDRFISGITRYQNAYPDCQIVVVASHDTCRELNGGTEIFPGTAKRVKLTTRQRISL